MHRRDRAHHHPKVTRAGTGCWEWSCTCGGHSQRKVAASRPWRAATTEALLHSTQISA